MGPAIITPMGPVLLQPFIDGTLTGSPALDDPEPSARPSDGGSSTQVLGDAGETTGGTANEPKNKPGKAGKQPAKVKKAYSEAQKAILLAQASSKFGL
jgi:hypothetical protein